jgi:uncharacterized protein (TIGR03437 family)
MTGRLDVNGNVSSELNGTRVLFHGVPAPLLYASATQLNVVVPYEVSAKTTTAVQVELEGTLVTAGGVPVTASAPGVFTLGAGGTGPAAVLNQDGTINDLSHPAARGSTIAIYATGEGMTVPGSSTGEITGDLGKLPALPVRVLIGDLEATVTYAGSAPRAIAGLFQVNAVVPTRVNDRVKDFLL